ncbi:hypothetical protein WAI453_001599 [Rhynchosporium graminicola]
MLVKARHNRTLEWSKKSSHITKWLAYKYSYLWLYGPGGLARVIKRIELPVNSAGSRKSVNSAFLIEHLQLACEADPSAMKAMAFYYFRSPR